MKSVDQKVLTADRQAILSLLQSLSDDDVVGKLSLESRLAAIDQELSSLAEVADTGGSVVLTFGGDPVQGSRAIDAEFSAKVLSSFQSLITTRVAVDDFGSLGLRGPIPTGTSSNLAITQLVRGSMGFLLEENSSQQQITDSRVKIAISQVAQLINSTALSEAQVFDRAVDTLDPRLFGALKVFFQTLDEARASVRIDEGENESILDCNAVRRGRDRLESTRIDERESESISGELLGILPDSRKFEMRLLESAEIIRGSVVAEYAATYLRLIESPGQGIVGKVWRTKMKIREVREQNKPPRNLYTLIELLEPLISRRPT